jgi:hypothetical protein
MTRYAVDEVRRALVGSWSAGWGDVAITVADLPSAVGVEQAMSVVGAATRLSGALWGSYTHPASTEAGLEPGTEGWQGQESRKAFALVAGAVREPHLPHDDLVVQEYVPVVEYAHQLGRALHAIGDRLLTDRVALDVQAELEAVGRAERGDLSGRARQAVALTRQDASPVQVAAADRVLHEDPLDGGRLFMEFDPAAAAVAAAHWLWAAAVVAAERSGLGITEVVQTADDIEALPWQSPIVVLGQLLEGEPPRSVVLGLISDAMLVAEGQLPDLMTLVVLAGQAEARSGGDPELCEELMAVVRPTPLDPSRPALDLLEDLLSGIRGCWLVFLEYARDPGPGDEQGLSLPAAGSDDGTEDDIDDETLTVEFIGLVRAAAAAEHDQLL